MLEGRPGDSYYRSSFYPDGTKINVDSLETETDVTGWQECSAQSKEGSFHGYGKSWQSKGRIFIGDIY
jgi:hypothetical protein